MIRFRIEENEYTEDQLDHQGDFRLGLPQSHPEVVAFVYAPSPPAPRVVIHVPGPLISAKDVVHLVDILLARQATHLRTQVLQEVLTKLEDDRQRILDNLASMREQIPKEEAAVQTINNLHDSLRPLLARYWKGES